MRKTRIAFLTGFVVLALGQALPTHADSNCAVSAGSDPVSAGAYDGGVQMCLNVSARGTVTATPTYIVVDGDSRNSEPFDGYVGYSAADGGVVICASGEYNSHGGNNALAVNPGGPCMPQPGV